jgi:hypothetical protein
MILLKLGLVAGFNGAVIPKMNVVYQPIPMFYVAQSMGIDVNGKYSSDLAQFNMEAGVNIRDFQVSIGHEASIDRTVTNMKQFNFVEVSFKKEF